MNDDARGKCSDARGTLLVTAVRRGHLRAEARTDASQKVGHSDSDLTGSKTQNAD